MFKWVLITLLVAFFVASWRIVVRKEVKKGSNELAFTALTDFVGAVFALSFLPFFKFTLPNELSIWILFLISGVFYAISDYLLIYGSVHAQVADASILTPLNSVYVLFASAIFLDEKLTGPKVISVCLIVIGSALTLYKGKRFVVNKGIIATFLYSFVITFVFLIDKGISENFSLPLYVSITYFVSSCILGLVIRGNRISLLKKEFNLQKKTIFKVGILWALFSLFLLLAYSYGEASRVIPFMRIFIVFVTLYSIFVLKEKERMVQKILGSFIVTVGAILLAYV